MLLSHSSIALSTDSDERTELDDGGGLIELRRERQRMQDFLLDRSVPSVSPKRGPKRLVSRVTIALCYFRLLLP